jgi:DNA-binding NtrC family response regulator
MKASSILIVDDKQDVLHSLKMFLKYEFEEIHLLTKPHQIIPTLKDNDIAVVLLDMNFTPGERSGREGLKWLQNILKYDQTISVVMLTAFADINLAVEAIKQGAMDFIVKPWENDKLVSTIHTGIKLNQSQKEVETLKEQKRQLIGDMERDPAIIWGQSKAMLELKKTINKIAPTDTNILVTGENGTGKELIARYIHQKSARMGNAFIKVDMGTLNENIFESEMFGHVKGGFTDARENRTGRFELANEGTLFMDEIGNLPLTLQAKMLSAIQDRTIQKVGSNEDIHFDARIITATNKNIDLMVKNNQFRQDLLYRLKTIHISIPPLRERKEDIPSLADFFLDKYSRKYDKPNLYLSTQALEKLKSHNWPGNIRELEHMIEKATILTETSEVKDKDFQLYGNANLNPEISENLNLEELEKKAIVIALEKHKHNLSKASLELGITRPTLYKKIRTYKINM